ncbi:hypothetical protein HA39_02195 [Pantoea brenneri]|nr:hypothetical protein HA39_02195 [Pantoea brenneri]
MAKTRDSDLMAAGIMAFVSAAKEYRAKAPAPKDMTEIHINAGFDLAIKMAEKCAEGILSQLSTNQSCEQESECS